MAIQFRTATTNIAGNSGAGNPNSLTLTPDASVQAGDLLVAGVEQAVDTDSLSGPAGWTQAGSAVVGVSGGADFTLEMWYRIAQAGDGGTGFTWNSTTNQTMAGAVTGIFDDGGLPWKSSPLDGTPSTITDAGGTTHATAGYSTTENNEAVIWAVVGVRAASSGTSWTTPAPLTERADVSSGVGAIALASLIQATAGGVGSHLFTFSTTKDIAGSIVAGFQLNTSPSSRVKKRLLRQGMQLGMKAGF